MVRVLSLLPWNSRETFTLGSMALTVPDAFTGSETFDEMAVDPGVLFDRQSLYGLLMPLEQDISEGCSSPAQNSRI